MHQASLEMVKTQDLTPLAQAHLRLFPDPRISRSLIPVTSAFSHDSGMDRPIGGVDAPDQFNASNRLDQAFKTKGEGGMMIDERSEQHRRGEQPAGLPLEFGVNGALRRGRDSNALIVRLGERVDLSACALICQAIEALEANRPETIVLDLSATRMIFDSGLALLLRLSQHPNSMSATLRLVNGVPRVYRRLQHLQVKPVATQRDTPLSASTPASATPVDTSVDRPVDKPWRTPWHAKRLKQATTTHGLNWKTRKPPCPATRRLASNSET